MSQVVAALYGLPDVDPWDEARDARAAATPPAFRDVLLTLARGSR